MNRTTTITPPKNTKNKKYITQLINNFPKKRELIPEKSNNNPARYTGLWALNLAKAKPNFPIINTTDLIGHLNYTAVL